MKKKRTHLKLLFLFVTLGLVANVYGHSVQVGYCVSCSGELTLYVEHWHGNEDPSTTTMTIQLNVNGVISTVTGSPSANLQNVTLNNLPGCTDPIHIICSCPSYANTYNDWVVYHFPSLPCGVPVVITIISGNSAFTDDCGGMYPASTPTILVPCNVHPPPVAAADQAICPSDSASLTLSNLFTTFQWQKSSSGNGPWTNIPGATNTPFSTGPLATTTYYRALETGACESNVVTITVNNPPTGTITGTTHVCENATAPNLTFTGSNGTAPYTFTYTINGGTNQTVVTTSGSSVTVAVPTATAGTFVYNLVSVTDENTTNCSHTTTPSSATVTVNPLPTATITGTTTVCKGDVSPLITFKGAVGTPPYTFTYTINGGAPSTITSSGGDSALVVAPTNTAGTFIYALVSVKDASTTTCSQLQTGTATVTVNPLPTATLTGTTAVCENATAPSIIFTGAGGTSPYTFTYTLNSGTNQTISTISGDTVSLVIPTNLATVFTYALISVHDASPGACFQAQSGGATVTVNPLPIAIISGTVTVCKNDLAPSIIFTGAVGTAPYTFSYTINGVAQPPVTSIGDSATVSVPTMVVGTFTYSLVNVKDASSTACSQAQTGSAVVTVNPLPTATITGTTGVCKNATPPIITFTGAAGTPPYTFTYTINGGTNQTVSSSGSNSSVTVAAPTNTVGTYTYALVSVKDASPTTCSETQTGTAIITVNPLPLANFGFADVCLHRVINFHDSSTVASGSITNWSWNYGNTTPLDANQNPSYTYPAIGTYTVTLIVTTNNGCKDTAVKTEVVHPLPDVHFSAANVCDGTSVTFTDLSTIPTTDSIEYWNWSFGEANTHATTQNTSHLFTAAGSYSVTLVATSYFGCSDSITKISVVNPNPLVNFTASKRKGCEPLCVPFQDSSFISKGSNTHWLWNTGDGSTPNTSQNFEHCYTNDSVFAPALFNVTLTVTSDSGCAITITKTNFITVYPNPIAKFTVDPEEVSIVNPIISITNASIGANFWNWNFGDSDTTSGAHPSPHTYADTGTYIITLVTSTLYGCVDTARQPIIIDPESLFYIPNAFSPNGDGVNDMFSGKGIFVKKYEMFIFDRWGNLIFYTDSIEKGWDGRANGGELPAQQDVYVYVVKYTDLNRREHTFRGIVSLVR
jgi:gliding motility-associated-like protein